MKSRTKIFYLECVPIELNFFFFFFESSYFKKNSCGPSQPISEIATCCVSGWKKTGNEDGMSLCVFPPFKVKAECHTSRLFKSFKFGNGSRISDENLVILEFKYLQNKKW